MLTLFKYIDYALKAKQGYEAPDELLADTSFGFIEGMFIMSFLILGLLGVLGIGFGIYFDLTFLVVIGIIFIIFLIIDIKIFLFLKRKVGDLSKKITENVRHNLQRKNAKVYNVEEKDINSTQSTN
ncbi:MAG: hypothetical protein MRY57_01225 [Candidatus Pacebacteria bacterium]|nr:hypothetical protein [Candidatus Paceibacterota bacterium]